MRALLASAAACERDEDVDDNDEPGAFVSANPLPVSRERLITGGSNITGSDAALELLILLLALRQKNTDVRGESRNIWFKEPTAERGASLENDEIRSYEHVFFEILHDSTESFDKKPR